MYKLAAVDLGPFVSEIQEAVKCTVNDLAVEFSKAPDYGTTKVANAKKEGFDEGVKATVQTYKEVLALVGDNPALREAIQQQLEALNAHLQLVYQAAFQSKLETLKAEGPDLRAHLEQVQRENAELRQQIRQQPSSQPGLAPVQDASITFAGCDTQFGPEAALLRQRHPLLHAKNPADLFSTLQLEVAQNWKGFGFSERKFTIVGAPFQCLEVGSCWTVGVSQSSPRLISVYGPDGVKCRDVSASSEVLALLSMTNEKSCWTSSKGGLMIVKYPAYVTSRS